VLPVDAIQRPEYVEKRLHLKRVPARDDEDSQVWIGHSVLLAG
jgi:hypothetical protein